MQYAVLLLAVTDPPPSDNDVKAGWGALALMLLLIAAVIFLFWSFTRQIRKVRAADEAGVYDDAEESGAGTTSLPERNPEQRGS
jgi:hypothetical protein